MREGLPGRSCVSPSHVSGNSTAGGGWWQRPSQVEETIWTKSRQGMHGECVWYVNSRRPDVAGRQVCQTLRNNIPTPVPGAQIRACLSHKECGQSCCQTPQTPDLGTVRPQCHPLSVIHLYFKSKGKAGGAVCSGSSHACPSLALPELGPSSSLPKETGT